MLSIEEPKLPSLLCNVHMRAAGDRSSREPTPQLFTPSMSVDPWLHAFWCLAIDRR